MIFINQRNAHAFLCNLQKHLYLTTDSVVLLEQIRVLDKQRLQARLGRLPYSYIQKIDKALAVSIGLWDKCWKHKDFVFICYPVQVSSHILAPRGGNLAHREFIYIGEPLPKLDEKEHAAFFLNLQKGILRSLKQRNLLTPAQYQECLAELGKRESKNQIRNTIKQKHSLWKEFSPIFTRIFNCQQHSLMWSRKLTTSREDDGKPSETNCKNKFAHSTNRFSLYIIIGTETFTVKGGFIWTDMNAWIKSEK